MTGILIRRGENIQRDKRQRSGEDGGRDGSELTIRQKKKKMQTIAGSHQKLERGKAKFFQELLRKRMPLLDIRLLVSRTERE